MAFRVCKVLAPAIGCGAVVAQAANAHSSIFPLKHADTLDVRKLACHIHDDNSQLSRERTPCVLLACGSYNPITLMHLRMFEAARHEVQKRGFDVLGGYISPVHEAYGKPGLVDNQYRIQMARIASTTSNWIMVDDWEASQPAYTRTVVVLQSLRSRLTQVLNVKPTESPVVMLLCGEDLLKSFSTPGVWGQEDIKAIFQDHMVVCISRPGSDGFGLVNDPESPLYAYKSRIILVHDVIDNPLSSTAVRQAVREGKSLKYMVPDEVVPYINRNALYKK